MYGETSVSSRNCTYNLTRSEQQPLWWFLVLLTSDPATSVFLPDSVKHWKWKRMARWPAGLWIYSSRATLAYSEEVLTLSQIMLSTCNWSSCISWSKSTTVTHVLCLLMQYSNPPNLYLLYSIRELTDIQLYQVSNWFCCKYCNSVTFLPDVYRRTQNPIH